MLYVAVAVAFVAVFSLYFSNFTWLIVAVISCLMFFGIVKFGTKYIAVFALFLLFTVSLFCEYQKINRVSAFDGKKISGEFVVLDTEQYENFNKVTVKVAKSQELPKNIKCLIFDYTKLEVSSGDVLSATLKLSEIESDDEYRLYDYGNGIYATASVVSAEKSDEIHSFYKFCGNIRGFVKQKISSLYNGDTAGFLIALTTGDKSILSESFLDNVKTTGVSHVIVVSGLHLSIIMSGIFLLLDRLFYNKYIRSLLSVIIIILISGVCGFTLSVIRAGVMFVIASIAPLLSRENDSLNSLFATVALVLVITPFAIVNVSFQLSFLSTIAIVWVVPFYTNICVEKFNISSKILKTFLNIIFCSVFAMIFCLPVTIRIFGYASVVAPITNLLITYPVTLALVFNVVALCFSVIPIFSILSYLLFWVASLCSRFTVFIVDKLSRLPVTVAILPDSAFIFILLLIFVIIAFMYAYEFKTKKGKK